MRSDWASPGSFPHAKWSVFVAAKESDILLVEILSYGIKYLKANSRRRANIKLLSSFNTFIKHIRDIPSGREPRARGDVGNEIQCGYTLREASGEIQQSFCVTLRVGWREHAGDRMEPHCTAEHNRRGRRFCRWKTNFIRAGSNRVLSLIKGD